MKGLANNQFEILQEWRPTEEQRRFAYNASGEFRRGGALNVGEKTHAAMLRFGARAAAALHFATTGQIVPVGGGIWSTWYTNERIIKGDFPSDFADVLPPHTTLGAGTKRALEGQFDYASTKTENGSMSVHMMTFRLSFAIQAAVVRDMETFRKIESNKPQLIFRPGFLKARA